MQTGRFAGRTARARLRKALCQRGRVTACLPLIAFCFLLAACGTAQPQPLVFGDAVWADGEISTYRVTNREDQIVGNATFAVTAGDEQLTGDGWTWTRQISDAGVQERATVQIQPLGYRPVYSLLQRTDNSGSQIVETQIDRTVADIALTNRQGATVYERVQVPSDIRDERTLALIVRSLPLAQGYATRLNSFLPVVGNTERVTVQVRGEERVTVPAGQFDTWLVELRTNDRTTKLWVAKDAPAPLVKFVDGRSQATFELTDFAPGG